MHTCKLGWGLIQIMILITGVMATACQPFNKPVPVIPLRVSTVQGEVFVQRSGKGEYTALKSGDSVTSADRLRAQAGSFAELQDERSFVAILADSEAVITALSSEAAVTRTQARLEKGAMYAEALVQLSPGMVEILTPGGSASIYGSGMIVSINSSTTLVGCTSGEASVTAGGVTQKLNTGQASSFISSGIPSQPMSLDQKLFGDDPLMMEVLNERYYHPAVVTPTSYPTLIEPTHKPTGTITPIPRATWTPMVLGNTSTPIPTGAGSLRRPTATVDAALSGGLTPEEQANLGEYTYTVACQAFSNCVCDSAMAVPSVTMTITFDPNGANLAAKEGQITYPRAAPNLFRITQENLIAEITFLPEGWELYVEKGGNVCSIQTYTRQ